MHCRYKVNVACAYTMRQVAYRQLSLLLRPPILSSIHSSFVTTFSHFLEIVSLCLSFLIYFPFSSICITFFFLDVLFTYTRSDLFRSFCSFPVKMCSLLPLSKLLIILLIRDINIYYFLCLASIFVSLFLCLNIISRTFKISSMINVK